MKTKYISTGVLTLLLSTQLVSASIDQNLKYGQRNSEVLELQEFLIDKGILQGQATGFFGLLTLKAVKNYQANLSLPATGYVGALTREKINKELSQVLEQSDQAEKQEVKATTTSATTQPAQAPVTQTYTQPVITQPVVVNTPTPTPAPVVTQPTYTTQTQSPVTPTPASQPSTPVTIAPQPKGVTLNTSSDFTTQTLQAGSTGLRIGSFIFDAGEGNWTKKINSIAITVNGDNVQNISVKGDYGVLDEITSTSGSKEKLFNAKDIGVQAFTSRKFDIYGNVTTGPIQITMKVIYRDSMTNITETITSTGPNIEVK